MADMLVYLLADQLVVCLVYLLAAMSVGCLVVMMDVTMDVHSVVMSVLMWELQLGLKTDLSMADESVVQ